jgi:predicted extracellular nuclease
MRSLVAVLLALVFAFNAGGQTIRVGAWNIEHLGEPNSRDFPMHRPTHGHGVAQNPVQIANAIQSMNLDVLALEEIYDTDSTADTKTNATLDAAFAHLNMTSGNNWSYELFANRIRSDTSQVCGLAWNAAKVEPVGRRLRIAVSDITTAEYAEWDRSPHAMKFTRGAGRTDFVVIAIHAKAGGGADEKDQREEEAKSLLRELPEIQENFEDTTCTRGTRTPASAFGRSLWT